MSKLSDWIAPRKRLWSIFNELGYVPWRKPRKPGKSKKGVHMGTREAIIPFLNDDAKRTISNLILRPGYMMRDYIFRGQHERFLAPITALLVFYSVFTLLVAIVQPGTVKKTFSDGILNSIDDITIETDSLDLGNKGDLFVKSLINTASQALVLTHLDVYPDKVDTPWKESLAAVEGDLRSKGVHMFLGNFFLLWLAMSLLLGKKYGVSVSGAAAASAYVLCQFCVFMFLALLVSLGQKAEIGVLLMGLLLFIDYMQLLGVGKRKALGLTLKTGLVYITAAAVFYLLVGAVLILLAYLRA